MTIEENKNTSAFSFSALIGVGTLIITAISLVPAFLALNKEKPQLYYSYRILSVDTPRFVDDAKFKEFLKENRIPSYRISIDFLNLGNVPAEEIKYSLKLPGKIVRYAYAPSNQEKPVWVDVPEDKEFGFNSTISGIRQEVKNLATDKYLNFTVGYEPHGKGEPEIEVYCNGKRAKYFYPVFNAPKWSPYKVFYLPASILGIGLGCTVLWVAGSILLRNPRVREELLQILKLFGKALIEAITRIRL